jgi:hypothetical protein
VRKNSQALVARRRGEIRLDASGFKDGIELGKVPRGLPFALATARK